MIDVFLLLGSNMGEREMFLQLAVEAIAEQVGAVTKQSNVHETLAWGKTDEPNYLNQVLLVETTLDAQLLLKTVLGIEKHLGRERKEKWGSRTIDIDILFYGNEIIDEPDLIIPHPYLHLRKFTLQPLSIIAPNFIHPVLKQTIVQLNNNLKT